MAKKPRFYRATRSFVVTENGLAADTVAAGELFHPDHPYVKRYIDHLTPTDSIGRFDWTDDVEQATSGPGEKRGHKSG
jgi:hypothetical protein